MPPIMDVSAPTRPITTPPLNRKYLRAFHDYQPAQSTLSGSTGGVSVTIPLKEGDVILVHLTHANGWADGTVLQSGARGWVPTNFCQPFDHPFIRNLMHALTQLWDYLSSEGGGKAMVEDRQDYVQGVIAGVRRLLEHCDCLHRDDGLIQKHIALRRTRKSLLAELSCLIKCRKQIQDTFSGDSNSDVSWSTIDDYMGKAFKVACRAVRFLDLWIQGAGSRRLRITSSFDQSVDPPLLSTTTASFSPTSPAHLRMTFEEDTQSGAAPAIDIYERPTSRDSHDSRYVRPQSAGVDSWNDRASSLHAEETDSRFAGSSPSQYRRSSPVLGVDINYPTKSGLSMEERSISGFASERLSAAHDHFLGHIGSFLGLHLQSRTSLDLAAATQRSLEACTGLFGVIKEIWLNDPQRSQEVSYAMMIMRRKLGRLADAAQRLCKNSDPLEDPALLKPEQGRGLVIAATACVRSAGDCTARARFLLDQNGDFEIDMDRVRQHQIHLANHSPVGTGEDDQSKVSEFAPDTVEGSEKTLESDIETTQESEVRLCSGRRSPHSRSKTVATSSLLRFSFPSEEGRRPSSSPEPPTLHPILTCIPPHTPTSLSTPSSFLKSPWQSPVRKESMGLSATESVSNYPNSFRNSNGSAMSPTSTRATTPDRSCPPSQNPAMLTSFSSISSMRSAATAGSESEGEAELLAKSYAHELLYNKESQVLGGTLRALVEKLTSQHSPPDPTFVSTFYLTFRLFTNAVDLANALISRYHYVGESKTESMPARLRVYNFFKGWLESHWLSKHDGKALGLIKAFAVEQLQPLLPSPGLRLAGLAEKASQQNITNTATQLVSSIGKMSVSLGSQYEKESVPNAIITRNQLNSLRTANVDMSSCSIVDFEALEIARQITLMQSHTFCAVEPEELLNLAWTKNSDVAVNVRGMARFATDLANLVADTILSVEDTKKRALVLKQWIKIGKACLDLSNYDCVMAIVCSLSSSTILRLRATWEQISQKYKAQFESLKAVVDMSRNYAVLRQRLQALRAPCLPFIGIYLTDLTFVDAGNQDTRILPSSDDTVQPVEVINFDKHSRTAKVISQLQRYQVPYRLQPVAELQAWLENQTARVRASEECCVHSFWRRSLRLEPRVPDAEESRPGTSSGIATGFRLGHKVSKSGLNVVFSREKLDFLSNLGFRSEGELKAKIAEVS